MDGGSLLIEVLRRLDAWGSARGWRGTDPYEGLNATRLLGPLRRSALGRRLVIQSVKRSPLNLRPLLGIHPGQSAAGVALVLSSYSRGGFLAPEVAERKLRDAVRQLEELRYPGYDEPCWGYHFEVQSRVLHYERGAPNTIATAFGGLALLDAHDASGDRRLLERALAVGTFFLRHVPQTDAGDGAFFGYLPGDRSPIHNANMLVAALMARLAGASSGNPAFRAAADAGLRYALTHQRPDGSWPYGELPKLSWVDNFHTGYMLDAVRACADAGVGGEAAEDAWRRGLEFYARELFLSDGTPKYLTTSVYPIDAQCVAQGIQTFALAGAVEPPYLEHAWRVLEFALERMRREDGLFLFQRRRLWTNRLPHVRWVVAPMMLALTHLLQLTPAPGPAGIAGGSPHSSGPL